MKRKIVFIVTLNLLLLFFSKCFAQNHSSLKVNIQEEISGKQLYENKCSKCHKLIEPTKFKQEKWQKMVKKMQKRAKVSDEEREKIYRYILSNL